MTDLPVFPMALAELEAQAAATKAAIPLIAITDDASFQLAVSERAEIKRRLARIDEVLGPICKATDEAHKLAVKKRDTVKAPLLEADRAYSREMGVYEQAQERARREREEAIQRERARLAAEEKARQDAEARRLQAIKEEEPFLAEAVAVVEAPPPPPPPKPVYIPPPPPKPVAAGVSFRDNWSAVVDDLLALVKAVADGKADVTFLMPNMTSLNGRARALKNVDLNIPGVRGVNERLAPQRQQPRGGGVFGEG